MHAAIISVGTELTDGTTVDSNAAWLSARLASAGWGTCWHLTVPDHQSDIADAIRRGLASADLVMVTGGLGPTPDDVTREALADVLDAPLEVDPQALESIRQFFTKIGRPCAPTNEKQAQCPRGATLIPNNWGTAPGVRADLTPKLVICLPGVPAEMRAMFDQAILPELENKGMGVLKSLSMHCFGAGESQIAEQIKDLFAPDSSVTTGITAKEGVITVRFSAKGHDASHAAALLEPHAIQAQARLGELVFGTDNQTLEEVVGGLLTERSLTIATAESCTGGLLAKRLTDVPGISACFHAALVTYHNRAKQEILGVDPDLLLEHGAVSEEVAVAMAEGCRDRCGTDLAVSITGVAGPSGGSPEKPVGLVFVGLADERGSRVRRLDLGTHLSRDSIRVRTCSVALNLVRLHLLNC